jgi:hypothetical protein
MTDCGENWNCSKSKLLRQLDEAVMTKAHGLRHLIRRCAADHFQQIVIDAIEKRYGAGEPMAAE